MPSVAAFDAGLTGLVYDLRVPIAIATAAVLVGVAILAHRLGWFAAARRHPGRSTIVATLVLAFVLPIGFYTISPLFIRSTLIEEGPIAVADVSARPSAPARGVATIEPGASVASTPDPMPEPTPTATPFTPATLATGEFTGTDDFHYGSGTASIIETAPGTFTLRLEEFSVRNGPDLFVYLSQDPDGYVDEALELGRLKATDGSFNYALPAGTDPSIFASALIWCKQFSHLFAVAPFVAD